MLGQIHSRLSRGRNIAYFCFVCLTFVLAFCSSYFLPLNQATADITIPGGSSVFLLLTPNPVTNGGGHFNPGDTSTGGTLCAIIAIFNSGIAQTLAALCVIFIGVAALFGQVKWTQAVLLGVGIAAMFGAAELVGSLPDIKMDDGRVIAVQGAEGTYDTKDDKTTCK